MSEVGSLRSLLEPGHSLRLGPPFILGRMAMMINDTAHTVKDVAATSALADKTLVPVVE
jgi:hypothetical protein